MNDNAFAGKLALGTVQFGQDYGISNTLGKTSNAEVQKLLELAWESGITMLDTARVYGDSEEVIGESKSKPFDIISKFKSDSRSDIRDSVFLSMRHLKVSSLYGCLAHDADTFINSPELWKELEDLKSEGIIKKAGYSLYTPLQLERLLDLNIIPDIIQIPFNFFDTRFRPFFETLKSAGVEIHARSAFLQGLFFVEASTLSKHFDEVKPYLKQLQEYFTNNSDLASWLLQQVLSEQYINKVVFGVNNTEQLTANLTGLKNQHTFDIERPEDIRENILMPSLWPKQ